MHAFKYTREESPLGADGVTVIQFDGQEFTAL